MAYMSGLAVARGVDVFSQFEADKIPDEAFSWLTKYCRKNPDSDFEEARDTYFDILRYRLESQ